MLGGGAELRWGVAPGSPEFATCNTQGDAHLARYNDEQSLRNALVRPPAGTPTPLGSGPATPEDIDVPDLLARLESQL
jgi:hypothetical protein